MSTKRCSVCGLRSDVDAFFRREKAGLFEQTVCAGCEPYRPAKPLWRRGLAATGLVATWVALTWLGMDHGAMGGPFLIALVLGAIAGVTGGVFIHEAGHALVARVLGHGVSRIVIGAGPVMARFKLGRARLLIKRELIGGGGRVHHIPPGLGSAKAGTCLIILAGAAANFVAVALGWWACLLVPDDPAEINRIAGGVLVGITLCNAFLGIGALIPYTTSDGAHVSDGLLLWRTPKQSTTSDTITEWRVAWLRHFGRHGEAAAIAFAAADGNSDQRARFLIYALSDLKEANGAKTALARCFERTELVDQLLNGGALVDEPYRALLQSNIAWFAMEARDERTDLIEHYSAASMTTKASPFPEVEGVRGAWLAMSGRDVPGGLDMLTWAVRRSTSPGMRTALCAYAARGYRAQNDEDLARAFEALQAHRLAIA
ncbi:MAG TPA: site-2 protease family protein [Caulobacteraceae bacterium]|nr:site-2 protease family protein [Caulobacteraceae bacterium]